MNNLYRVARLFGKSKLATGWPPKNGTVDTVDFQDFALSNSYLFPPCWIEHRFLIRPIFFLLCCPHPTDSKVRKKQGRVFFFFFFLFYRKCQIWAKNLLNFFIQWLKKALVYAFWLHSARVFSILETFKKILENSTLSRYVKQKTKNKIDFDPTLFKFCACEGNIIFYFFGLIIIPRSSNLVENFLLYE